MLTRYNMERPRNCWHLCTKGLKDKLLFRDRKDFIHGMNSVALCSLSAPVAVLAFCLMDNHVHLVVNGIEDRCRHFMRSFMVRTALNIRVKYGETNPLTGVEVTIKKIDSLTYLGSVIAYVHRNPMAAGICAPYNYEWCSAALPFRSRQSSLSAGILKVGDYSEFALRTLLKTRMTNLPANWKIGSEGMVLPESYLRIGYVEKLYGSIAAYMYALNRNNDARLELDLVADKGKAYDDATLASFIPAICMEEFGVEGFDKLDIDRKCEMAILLRKRYGSGVKQIARLTGLTPDFLKSIFGERRPVRGMGK